MKNLRKNMERFYDKLDKRWQSLSVGKQRRYTLYFFVGYLMLSIGVVFKVWYDTNGSKNNLHIEHIENPVLKKREKNTELQDTLATILKNKIYERN